MVVLDKEYSMHELDAIAHELVKLLPQCKVMTFQGSLGAGKTTLVGSLLRACGVQEIITSPTFTYVNAYQNAQGEQFYHFDCYRLDTAQAFVELGFDEYVYAPHSWAFIEWPEVIDSLLKDKVCRVVLEYVSAEKRHIKVTL